MWELRELLSNERNSISNAYYRSFDEWASVSPKSQSRMYLMLLQHDTYLAAVKRYRYLLINWFNGSRTGNPPNLNQVTRMFERASW
jgi:hypothetical protein